VYASIADIRAEGILVATASDARLTDLLDEATRWIDRVTGWFFEPRTLTIRMDGRGSPSVEPYVPPISITHLYINDEEVSHDPADLVVVGSPLSTYYEGPRLTLRHGRFPKGRGNVVVEGSFGVTEDDGTSSGRTPAAIRRACMLLVLRTVNTLADDASYEARNRWRIVEEQTRDQRYRLAESSGGGGAHLSGDPEVDALLLPYMKPGPVGAV
jgi:hypothetical protein